MLSRRDRVFLLCFSNRLRPVNDCTSDVPRLLASLEAYQKGNTNFPEIEPRETRPACCNTAYYDAVYHSSTVMMSGAEPGRRLGELPADRRAVAIEL
ncbi:hypothetical protein SBA3_540018 [Candidatus Sulfopaludibacter sp. SbA3]|nr:hypothetical protein SBA3_540018 [Candidatus Sulfopaludibacter sp. SbA3]